MTEASCHLTLKKLNKVLQVLEKGHDPIFSVCSVVCA